MVYSPDMSGGFSDSSYDDLEPSDQGDVIDHPAHNLPVPMQPRRPEGIKMAGDVIPFPAARANPTPNLTAAKNELGVQAAERSGTYDTNKIKLFHIETKSMR